MYCLLVKFRLRDEAAVVDFDQTVATVVPQIAGESGTLIYATHRQEDQPLCRVFYEVYQDVEAWRVHSEAPYIVSFLSRAGELMSYPPEVEVLEVGPFTGWSEE
jgi:quinol monooxygenase YgiN